MEIRAIAEHEVSAWRRCLVEAFGGDLANDPLGDERFRALMDRSRALGAFERGAVVGTAAGYDFSLSVPGGSVPLSGLSMVSVRPTHRRRGVLRALMTAYLEAARRHGDPISGLWASEATIYGRFGYGIASESEVLALAPGAGGLARGGSDPDELEMPADEALPELLPGIYRDACAVRPGLFERSPAWWKYRRFADRADLRGGGGASARRHVVARRGDAATGYAVYRQRSRWDAGVSSGALEIEELVAIDSRAECALWRFLADFDLYPRVSWGNAPVDALAPWLLADPRRLSRRRIDGLWLRIEDVAAALEARAYAADGALRLAVDGEVYELRASGGRGRCTRSGAAPELKLERAALGSIYLGAFAPSLLARCGRLSGDPSALALADRLFAWPLAPWCPEAF